MASGCRKVSKPRETKWNRSQHILAGAFSASEKVVSQQNLLGHRLVRDHREVVVVALFVARVAERAIVVLVVDSWEALQGQGRVVHSQVNPLLGKGFEFQEAEHKLIGVVVAEEAYQTGIVVVLVGFPSAMM